MVDMVEKGARAYRLGSACDPRLHRGHSKVLEFAEPALDGDWPEIRAVQLRSDWPFKEVAATHEDVVIYIVVHRHDDHGVSWVDLLLMLARTNAKKCGIACASATNVEVLVVWSVRHLMRHIEINMVGTEWLGAEVHDLYLELVIVPLTGNLLFPM